MNAAPVLTDSGRREPNTEDLDSVLGRFQEWTKSRRDSPLSKYGSAQGRGRSTPTKKADLAPGARELSYEQALRASSYRRENYPERPEASPPAPKPQEAISSAKSASMPDPGNARGNIADFRKPTPGAVSNGAHAAEPPAGKRTSAKSQSATGTRTAAANVPVVSIPAANVPISAATAPPVSVVGSQPVTAPGSKNRRRRPGKKSAAKPAQRVPSGGPSLNSTLTVASDVSITAQPQSSTPPRKLPVAQPAFRQVFEETAELVTTAKVESKSIALSLRVSDAEHARIQACAARENLSVSAYLRQCALGVDVLRDQVQLALGQLQKQDTKPAPPPGLAAIPGILGRSANRWFRRLRGRNDYTGISLR